MASTTHPSLNAEPSQPTEREESHLPPKTYADAAEEGLNYDGPPTPMEFVGHGEDEAPRSPMRKLQHKKSGSLRSNGSKKGRDNAGELQEKIQDGGREKLTSVKASPEYFESLRRDEKDKMSKKNNELVSGRRAGAGWERSGYISYTVGNNKFGSNECP